ncbi:hypothetical protein CEUSTIGMA_g5823.t1 [Chlamydomonas eustigma]|uniref:Uncharacterized protein n=1 Tax=Chlamydomonas eustigma TaxID=1157962 RepID=A0A250X5M6_9CHLO|nr:hypothetical protein CEUSTIGMA_g5823.t1 [Chlamydomonas eustigma]|eukprot:GAX78381.1 hypothetical protein CEUSTIGMA_g5823.t1 [Chlamydomonas eustigma]
MRNANFRDVAYFPKPVFPQRLSSAAKRQVKLHMLSLCLGILLKDIKALSHSGVNLVDPWGNNQFVVPMLFSYVGDEPEIKDLSCVKGPPSAFPCEFCMVFLEQLSNLSIAWPQRTESTHNLKLQEALAAQSVARRNEICSALSMHAVPSGLWGFNLSNSAILGGAYQCFSFEAMHNEDLGVFLYIVDTIKPYLEQYYGTAASVRMMVEINERMRQVPRATDFALPYCDGEYIPNHSRVQARELRNVMQVLPFLLDGLDDDLVEVAALYVMRYKLAFNKQVVPNITESTLIQIDETLAAFHEKIQSTLASHMPSEGQTIKYHKLSHITTWIKRLGDLKHIAAQFFEGRHHRSGRNAY